MEKVDLEKKEVHIKGEIIKGDIIISTISLDDKTTHIFCRPVLFTSDIVTIKLIIVGRYFHYKQCRISLVPCDILVFRVGRLGTYKYLNINQCIAAACELAEKI